MPRLDLIETILAERDASAYRVAAGNPAWGGYPPPAPPALAPSVPPPPPVRPPDDWPLGQPNGDRAFFSQSEFEAEIARRLLESEGFP